MQAVNANGVPVVITTQAVGSTQDKRLPYINMKIYLSRQLKITGSLQIVFGVFSIIFEIVSLAIYETFGYLSLAFVGYGFWIGVLFVVTGSFGIVGGRKHSRCHVIAFNVLSILSACFAALLLSLAIPSAVIYASYYSYYYDYYYDYNYYYYYYYTTTTNIPPAVRAGIAMESLMTMVAVLEAIVAIWSSVVCCKIGACCCDCDGDCCCPRSVNTTQIAMTGQPHVGQPYVGHPYVGQPFAGQPPAGQQQIVMYHVSNQNQPVMIANQQPLFYPLASNQQSTLVPNDQNNVMEHGNKEYTRLQR